MFKVGQVWISKDPMSTDRFKILSVNMFTITYTSSWTTQVQNLNNTEAQYIAVRTQYNLKPTLPRNYTRAKVAPHVE